MSAFQCHRFLIPVQSQSGTASHMGHVPGTVHILRGTGCRQLSPLPAASCCRVYNGQSAQSATTCSQLLPASTRQEQWEAGSPLNSTGIYPWCTRVGYTCIARGGVGSRSLGERGKRDGRASEDSEPLLAERSSPLGRCSSPEHACSGPMLCSAAFAVCSSSV